MAFYTKEEKTMKIIKSEFRQCRKRKKECHINYFVQFLKNKDL